MKVCFISLFLSLAIAFTTCPLYAQTGTVLYNFCSVPYCLDGGNPTSNLTPDGAGNFYGTTSESGATNQGTVFELSPDGNGGWNESVIHTFAGGSDDGANPLSGVIFDSAGNLYGTTQNGGSEGGSGVVFELSPVAGGWTETILASFGYREGLCGAPVYGLVMDREGNLYGATSGVYTYCKGIAFELSPSTGGTWTINVIGCCFYFASASPAVVMDSAGDIFGAVENEVFELSPKDGGGWNLDLIHIFSGTKDGNYATGAPVLDSAGNLFGATAEGGSKNLGTVYKLTPRKNGTWAETILYSFKGGKQGSAPLAGLVLDDTGNIYGTTYTGGKYGFGTVFELAAPTGKGSYKETVLWSFNGQDGANPHASLALENGKLFGTTQFGGPNEELGDGVVFEVNPSPSLTATSLSSSPNPSTHGQVVSFTAVITSSAGAPPDGEMVSFMEGKVLLGTGTLSGGAASLATSTLKVGTRSVTAVYEGEINFAGSTSNLVKQVVEKSVEQ